MTGRPNATILPPRLGGVSAFQRIGVAQTITGIGTQDFYNLRAVNSDGRSWTLRFTPSDARTLVAHLQGWLNNEQ